MESVASTLHTTSEHGVSSITTVDAHTSAASSRLNDASPHLNGLVRFAERRNLVSARVPSHFKRSLRLAKRHWVMKTRTIRWMHYMAIMAQNKMHGKLKEKCYLPDLSVDWEDNGGS